MTDRQTVPAAQAAFDRPSPPSPAALFRAFNRLALQGFGGVLPVAQRELVDRLRWLSLEQFLALLSLSQVLPGPNIVNLGLILGDRFFGWRGGLAAMAGFLCFIVIFLAGFLAILSAAMWSLAMASDAMGLAAIILSSGILPWAAAPPARLRTAMVVRTVSWVFMAYLSGLNVGQADGRAAGMEAQARDVRVRKAGGRKRQEWGEGLGPGGRQDRTAGSSLDQDGGLQPWIAAHRQTVGEGLTRIAAQPRYLADHVSVG